MIRPHRRTIIPAHARRRTQAVAAPRLTRSLLPPALSRNSDARRERCRRVAVTRMSAGPERGGRACSKNAAVSSPGSATSRRAWPTSARLVVCTAAWSSRAGASRS